MLKGLGNLGNLGNIGNLMKQVQDMQSKMTEVEEELAKISVEGSAGGGMVTVVANGKQDVLSIDIDPDVFTENERDMVQDMIVAAVNQALETSRELRVEKLSHLTGGLKIPGMM